MSLDSLPAGLAVFQQLSLFRWSFAALLKAGADPCRPASRNEPRDASVSTERGTYVVARALYAENRDIARELLNALFGLASFAKGAAVPLVSPRERRLYDLAFRDIGVTPQSYRALLGAGVRWGRKDAGAELAAEGKRFGRVLVLVDGSCELTKRGVVVERFSQVDQREVVGCASRGVHKRSD